MENNSVHSSFKHGKNFKIGNFCLIEKNCEVGDNVDIQNYVLLKEGTKIGNSCYIDSYVLFSGDCRVGNNVVLRYQSVIARNVVIEDNVFFTPGVKTIYLDQKREATKELIIKRGSFFGNNVVIMGGITVAENSIFGACTFVNKDTEPNGVYVGSPARRLRDVTIEEINSMKNI